MISKIVAGLISAVVAAFIMRAFIPVFIALDSDYNILQTLLEPLLRLFQGLL